MRFDANVRGGVGWGGLGRGGGGRRDEEAINSGHTSFGRSKRENSATIISIFMKRSGN